MAKRRRDNGKRRAWREVVAGQRRSGLSIRAYCRQEGVSEAAFYWWRRRLAGRRSMPSERTPRSWQPRRRGTAALWAPVAVTTAAPRAAIEVVLPGGIELRVHAAADARLLFDVLAALGNRAALERRPC